MQVAQVSCPFPPVVIQDSSLLPPRAAAASDLDRIVVLLKHLKGVLHVLQPGVVCASLKHHELFT